eukprot:PhF_6_TR15474/c0_g1_i2/m.24064
MTERKADAIASKLTNLGNKFANAMQQGSTKASNAIEAKGADIADNVTEKKNVEVSTGVKVGMMMAKGTSEANKQTSAQTIVIAEALGEAVGSTAGGAVKNRIEDGKPPAPEDLEKKQKIEDAKKIAGATLALGSTVIGATLQAGANVAKGTASATIQVVESKYGQDAGAVVRDSCIVVGNTVETAVNAKKAVTGAIVGAGCKFVNAVTK